MVVYSVPEGRQAVISRIFIMNNDAGNAIVDLSFVPGGANDIGTNATAPVNKLLDAFTLATKTGNQAANNIAGGGITLDELDDIRFKSDVADVVIHVFGVEVMPEKN